MTLRRSHDESNLLTQPSRPSQKHQNANHAMSCPTIPCHTPPQNKPARPHPPPRLDPAKLRLKIGHSSLFPSPSAAALPPGLKFLNPSSAPGPPPPASTSPRMAECT